MQLRGHVAFVTGAGRGIGKAIALRFAREGADIALVDLKRYRLIRKGGVEQASSIHVRFTQGEHTLRAFYRVDGQPMPRSAVTPFKGTNTVSPFIGLATRS